MTLTTNPTAASSKLQSYAVFAGGGVKGAAFAGALRAARKHGIQFLGFGGTSAGSLVALLASLGYTEKQIRREMLDLNFVGLLCDGDAELYDTIRKMRIEGYWSLQWTLHRHRRIIKRLMGDLGFFRAQSLKKYVLGKIHEMLPNRYRGRHIITFRDLREARKLPLKVVASSLSSQRPVIFGTGTLREETSVVDAIRASISYPFFFRPVPEMGSGLLVDGGLTTNLPVFLFDEEQRRRKVPVMAFDLDYDEALPHETPNFKSFVSGLVSTALDATDVVQLAYTRREHLFWVRIPISRRVESLDIRLDRQKREELCQAGFEATDTFIREELEHVSAANGALQQRQAVLAPPGIVTRVLAALVTDVATVPNASKICAFVLLPSAEIDELLESTFEYGDVSASLGPMRFRSHRGLFGLAYSEGMTALADLGWGSTTQGNIDLLPAEIEQFQDRFSTLMLTPIRETQPSGRPEPGAVRGVLCIGTRTALEPSGWSLQPDSEIRRSLLDWADVLGRVFP